jgi:hypothetical protein
MHIESVDTPSLLELRAIVAQRLQAYGALEGCTLEDQRTILAQACMVIWHLTAEDEGRLMYLRHLGSPVDGMPYQTVLGTMARLCPDVIAAVQGYVALWRAQFRQDGWHRTQWTECCDGINGTLLEVFVTDTRQRALAACERDTNCGSVLRER